MSIPVAVKAEEVILENVEYNSAEEIDEELQLQLEDTGGEPYQIQYSSDSFAATHRQRHQNSNARTNSVKDMNGGGDGGGSAPSKNILESEKRIRREIANSNERRRMQSINAGFQNLRSLLPRHEGEKLSKAAILQQTSQYICELENQKTQLLAQNSQLKRQLGQHEVGTVNSGGNSDATGNESGNGVGGGGGVAIKKRKLTDNVINMQTISDSSDEGLGSMSPEPMTLLNVANAKQTATANMLAQTAAKELIELKKQLDKERCLRTMLEDELQMIKQQLYSVATAPAQSSAVNYIPREVIEHTDNIVHEDELLPAGTVSYVEIDELTGQQQVVVCTSIEELDESDAGIVGGSIGELISEETLQEQEQKLILSTTTSESEQQQQQQQLEVNAVAKAYAEGKSAAVLQPILQAAIKATPKVEVEHINEALVKVKTEMIEQPSGLTRSRQNLETIVEAIRHLEGDHLFGDVAEQQKQQQLQRQQQQHHHQPQQQQQKLNQKAQEAPLALTTTTTAAATAKQAQQQLTSQRNTLAELRPFLQLKCNNKQMTIVGGTSITLASTASSSSLSSSTSSPSQLNNNSQHNNTSGSNNSNKANNNSSSSSSSQPHNDSASSALVTPTAILKVQTSNNSPSSTVTPQQVTITTTALKQCRPGVIVAKKLS